MYFETSGPQNTEKALEIAIEEAEKRNINYVVIASTTGETALKALKLLQGKKVTPVIVTHNTGFANPGEQQFDPQIREKVCSQGGKVLTSTMPLRNIGSAIRKKFGYSQEELVNATLRIFGQGTKVCLEIVAMAADAGLIPFVDVIAVAGTAKGSDTVLLIRANSSNNFFDLKVKEVIAKPKEF